MDVGEHAARCDGDRAEQLVELLDVSHYELEVARHDARLFVVAHRVASEFEDLGARVLEDDRKVHGRARAYASRVLARLEVVADAPPRGTRVPPWPPSWWTCRSCRSRSCRVRPFSLCSCPT